MTYDLFLTHLNSGATLGMMDKRGRDGPAKDAGWAIGAIPLVVGGLIFYQYYQYDDIV